MFIVTPWRHQLLEALGRARQEVTVISPFIKAPIAASVVSAVDRAGISVRTITRFKMEDFSAGVSDIDAAWMLSAGPKDRLANFALRTDNRLHAKIYLIDRETAYIGSSNLTFSGLMRNWEATVLTQDRKVIEQLEAEIESYWNKCTSPADGDFAAMVRRLQAYGRRSSSEEEHLYEIRKPLELFDTESEADPSWIDAEIAAPIQRVTEDLQDPGAHSNDTLGDTSPNAEQLIAIDDRLGVFLDILSHMGLRVDLDREAYARVLRHPSIRSLSSLGTDPPIRTRNFDPQTFFDPPGFEDEIGKAVFEIASFSICVRSGILSRFGRGGMSAMLGAARGRRTLATLWDMNFLGSLLRASSATDGERYALVDAAYRLMGTVALVEGVDVATEFIEHYFNPLDVLGNDMAAVIGFKDAKTALQQVTQAQAHLWLPVYEGHVNLGTEDAADWRCVVRVGKAIAATGQARRKQDAELQAAEKALTIASRHPTLGRLVGEELQMGLTKARVRHFLLSPNRAGEVEGKEVRRAYKEFLGCEIEPRLGLSAIIDVETSRVRHMSNSNQSLTILGRALLRYGLLRRRWRRGATFATIPTSREMTDEIAAVVRVEAMRTTLGFDNRVSRQSLVDTSVAVLAAVCLHNGYERGLEAFETVLAQIDERQNEIAEITLAGSTISRLRALPDAIDSAASYTQFLQELTVSIDGTTPVYSTRFEGPSNASTAITSASWRDWRCKCSASTKQQSRQLAAFELLRAMRPSVGALEEESLAFSSRKAEARSTKSGKIRKDDSA